ncbi:DNA-directed RNA polymerase [Coemansia sp. RSA 1285]|nr:DNA-directed RNA polymerase [Coemansia sp. RSA 1285]
MSQLMLRAVRSFGSTMHRRPSALRHSRLPIAALPRLLEHRLHALPAGFAHRRHFTEKPTLRSAQAVMAEADDQSLLLTSSDNDLVSTNIPTDESGLEHYIQTGRTLTEQLATMYACLSNGNIESAQRMFNGLYRLYPEAMRSAADVTVHNEIIHSLLNACPQPMTMDTLVWYDKMEKQYAVRPNHNTFAIMISGFIK